MTGSGLTKMLLEEGEHEVKLVKAIDEFYVYEAKKRVFIGDETSIDVHFELKKELTAKGRAKKAKEDAIRAEKRRLEAEKKARYEANKIKHLKRVGNVVIDKKRNLMWQDDVAAKTVTRDWRGAKRYCQNLSLGGYSDWRLPDFYELMSIVDYDRYDPAIFSLFENTALEDYWSSTTSVSDSSNAWYVYFDDGGSDRGRDKTYSNYVRCVRSGE